MRHLRAVFVLSGSLLAATALLVCGAQAASPVVRPRPGVHPPVEELAVGAAGLGLALAGCWLALATGCCLHDLARAHAPVAADAALTTRPRGLRRALLRACAPAVGAAVLSVTQVAVTQPALALSGDSDNSRNSGSNNNAGRRHLLDGLPLPDRPVLASPARPRSVHTVRAGDCLWSVAAQLLGPRATPAAIDRGWRAIHRANLRRIGPDPDLLVAGTRLELPASLHRPAHQTRRGAP